jgi:hypothetical protein
MKRAAILFSVLLTAPLGAVELQPLLHLDLRGGYAAVADQQTPLLQGQLFAVPAVKFSDQASLMPSLYFLGGGQERSLQQGALFVRTATMGFRPQLKLRQDSGAAWTLFGDLRHAYNVEAVNESYGLGHYDYEDYSLGLGWDRPLAGLPMGLTFKAGHRDYPNYHNIAAEQTQGLNYYIKDFYSAQGEAHADLAPWGRLSASLEMRNYPDAFVVGLDGQVDPQKGEHQQDTLLSLSLRGGQDFGEENRYGASWALSWDNSSSNQNVFDATRTDGGLAHGNDYSALNFGGGLQWRPSDGWGLQGSYNLGLHYLARPVQSADGAYQADKISELENDFSLSGQAPLPWGLKAVAGLDAQILASNQQYAAAGVPSYSSFSATAGFQWDWKGGN